MRRDLIEENVVPLALQDLCHLSGLVLCSKGTNPHPIILPLRPIAGAIYASGNRSRMTSSTLFASSLSSKAPTWTSEKVSLCGRWLGCLFGHDDTHTFRPVLHYPNTVGGGAGEIDDTPLGLRIGSTVVDLDLHLFPSFWIFHHHFSTEREGTMRSRHLMLREAVTIGGLPPVEDVSDLLIPCQIVTPNS
jgi:hypothetical protein